MGVVYALSRYVCPNPLTGLALLWLNSMLLLAVSLAGGAAFSTVTNGVLAFGLYGIAFIGGWIEHIGAFAQNRTAVLVGIVSSFFMPCESLWRRASFEMQSPIVAAIGVSPFASPSSPSVLMVGYAALYACVALLLAFRAFNRRDL
jgi:hypothetical protein